MKNTILIVVLLLITVSACIKNDHIDTVPPVIDLAYPTTFPSNCDTLYYGETFVLKMFFSDNVELGSFSIDIHHNFDHHSHSTEVNACSPEPIKSPVNPFVLVEEFKIPSGLKEYTTNLPITLPSQNDRGIFDGGDYHLMIRLTDKEGWSTMKGLSIKILYRNPKY